MKDLFLGLRDALSNLDVDCSDRQQVSNFVDFLYQDRPDTEKTADIKTKVINLFNSLPSGEELDT